MKKIFLNVLFIFIMIRGIYSEDYIIKKIPVNELSYSIYSNINNDIKIYNNSLYIFSLKDYFKVEDKYKNQSQSNRGYLKEIFILTENLNLKEIIVNSINKFEYSFLYKHYYLDKNLNIIYHNPEDIETQPYFSKKIEIYNIKENLIKTIRTPRSIEDVNFFINNDVIYYLGVREYKPGDIEVISDFCIYDVLKNTHKVLEQSRTLNLLKIINIVNNSIYMTDFGKSVYIFDKKTINEFEYPTYDKKILLDDFLYQKYNLMFFSGENHGISEKNNIIYQIRFLAESDKQTDNVDSKINSLSKQTLLISFNPVTKALVKEIKINYSPRQVCESPNSYDVDDEGNIYILDSKNKNIIKIDKSVNKIEINYK